MILETIAKELKLKPFQVKNTVELLDADNTVPFIARYRKEATGELNEDMIRAIEERLTYLRNLEARKEEVIRLIDEQGKLDAELNEAIMKATKLQEVEDLYRPYKQKRRTRATIAKEKGLEPLAEVLFAQQEAKKPEELAVEFVNPELGVETVAEALQGAMDIIAEQVSDDAELRKYIRQVTMTKGLLVIKGKEVEGPTPYDMYLDYSELVGKIPPHRILAVNRGEAEEVLSVKIEAPVEEILSYMQRMFVRGANPAAQLIVATLEDSYKRLIAPSIEREVRNELTTKGEEQAVKVFGTNVKNLLLQAPISGKRVLGVDPSFRTGCKYAVVDDIGKVEKIGVVYPHAPQNKWAEAKAELKGIIDKYAIDVVAIGNGTASRETETLVAETLKECKQDAAYVIVSEAGASVYSASKVAQEEFPDFDLTQRSAVSIARRLQDPLAELVKIEPKAIGVGQYQHDVNPKYLEDSLAKVVESAVNSVGVDLNTASVSLLQYVSGLKPSVAKNIVAFREKTGRFLSRAQLKKVPRLGDATFVQCAGFLRVSGGEDVFDSTPVHPESYELAAQILDKVGFSKTDLSSGNLAKIRDKLKHIQPEAIATELGAGVPTVRDIIDALQKPGRDPREDLPKPILAKEVTSIENLKEGMVLQGTVRNVVDFGAFVDIGIKHDGLVHISQLSNKFIKHPMEAVAVGDVVKVKVIGIDHARERVSLSMKEVE